MKYLFRLLFIIIIGIAYQAATAQAQFFPTYNPNGGIAPRQQVDPSEQTRQAYLQTLQRQQDRQMHCTYQQNVFGTVTQTCN